MPKQILRTDKAPAAIGPYSQAVRAGDLLFLSGQVPIDPSSGGLVAESIVSQTRRVMDNLGAVLGAAGADFSQVVKATIYLTNLADFDDVNRVYGSYFPSDPPARATVQVAALPRRASVEIELTAYLGA